MADEYRVAGLAVEAVEALGTGPYRVGQVVVEVLYAGAARAQAAQVAVEALIDDGKYRTPARVSWMAIEALIATAEIIAVDKRRAAQIIG